jgi:hypothetical protein
VRECERESERESERECVREYIYIEREYIYVGRERVNILLGVVSAERLVDVGAAQHLYHASAYVSIRQHTSA